MFISWIYSVLIDIRWLIFYFYSNFNDVHDLKYYCFSSKSDGDYFSIVHCGYVFTPSHLVCSASFLYRRHWIELVGVSRLGFFMPTELSNEYPRPRPVFLYIFNNSATAMYSFRRYCPFPLHFIHPIITYVIAT